MKRRDFLGAVAATATVPALPARALVGFAGAAVPPELLSRAAVWVRLWDYSTVDTLKYRFGVDDDTARGLLYRLADDNLISAPDLAGTSRVVDPILTKPFSADKLERMIDGRAFAALKKAGTLRNSGTSDPSIPQTEATKVARPTNTDILDHLDDQESKDGVEEEIDIEDPKDQEAEEQSDE